MAIPIEAVWALSQDCRHITALTGIRLFCLAAGGISIISAKSLRASNANDQHYSPQKTELNCNA